MLSSPLRLGDLLHDLRCHNQDARGLGAAEAMLFRRSKDPAKTKEEDEDEENTKMVFNEDVGKCFQVS